MYPPRVKPAGANPGFALNSFVSQLKQPTDTFGLQKLCHTEKQRRSSWQQKHSIPFPLNINLKKQ